MVELDDGFVTTVMDNHRTLSTQEWKDNEKMIRTLYKGKRVWVEPTNVGRTNQRVKREILVERRAHMKTEEVSLEDAREAIHELGEDDFIECLRMMVERRLRMGCHSPEFTDELRRMITETEL